MLCFPIDTNQEIELKEPVWRQQIRQNLIFKQEDGVMATYVTLYKITDQGSKDLKNAPKRIEDGIKRWEALGGNMLGFYATLGDYDYISISEHPEENVATTFILGLNAMGNVKTTTLRAFTKEEFAGMLEKLP
jgi:uncharacterized protein with GYD domain